MPIYTFAGTGRVGVTWQVFFGILGPLLVRGGDRLYTPSAPQLRTVLALLLASANRPVPVTALVDELWPSDAPASATAIVQICVSRIRKVLRASGGSSDAAAGPLRTEPGGGYSLAVGADQLDEQRFLRGADDGSRLLAAGDPARAAAALHAALAEWRGPALVDVPAGPALAAHAVRLEEHRTRALEDRIEAAGHVHAYAPISRTNTRCHNRLPAMPIDTPAAPRSSGVEWSAWSSPRTTLRT